MNPILPVNEEKRARKWAKIATIIYVLLFPVLFMLALASFMIFDSPSMTIPAGLSIIFMYFCVPLSIPPTIYFVWSKYSKGDYKRSLQLCWVPVWFFGALIAYPYLLDFFGFI